jgi:hypothetical protein
LLPAPPGKTQVWGLASRQVSASIGKRLSSAVCATSEVLAHSKTSEVSAPSVSRPRCTSRRPDSLRVGGRRRQGPIRVPFQRVLGTMTKSAIWHCPSNASHVLIASTKTTCGVSRAIHGLQPIRTYVRRRRPKRPMQPLTSSYSGSRARFIYWPVKAGESMQRGGSPAGIRSVSALAVSSSAGFADPRTHTGMVRCNGGSVPCPRMQFSRVTIAGIGNSAIGPGIEYPRRNGFRSRIRGGHGCWDL